MRSVASVLYLETSYCRIAVLLRCSNLALRLLPSLSQQPAFIIELLLLLLQLSSGGLRNAACYFTRSEPFGRDMFSTISTLSHLSRPAENILVSQLNFSGSISFKTRP